MMTESEFDPSYPANDGDPLLERLLSEAREVVSSSDPTGTQSHPPLLSHILSPSTSTFEEAVALIVAHRLTVFSPASFSCDTSSSSNAHHGGPAAALFSPQLHQTLLAAMSSPETECGHTFADAVRADAAAIVDRDPACETLLEACLFMKGFAALVCHRAARRRWPSKNVADGSFDAVPSNTDNDSSGGVGSKDNATSSSQSGNRMANRFAALLLQSQAAAAFGVDIHPAASIGAGVVIDHGTGVVVGETATVGDGCTILHGVTLGGTAKDGSWDRHPKIGRDVLIGAGSSILGNIRVGDGAKIGSGSVVLRCIPSHATAVGAPAKIIGYAKEEKPGTDIDMNLDRVDPLIEQRSSSVLSQESSGGETSTTEPITDTDLDEVDESDEDKGKGQKNEEEEEKQDDKTAADATMSPPGCRKWVSMAKAKMNPNLCPWRDLRCSGVAIPKGAVNRETLFALLTQEGCTEDEIGEVYSALLRFTPSHSQARRHGYIPPCLFHKKFPECAAKFTKIPPARADAIARGDGKELKLCRRATVAFSGVFEGLQHVDDEGQISAPALSLTRSMTPASVAANRGVSVG